MVEKSHDDLVSEKTTLKCRPAPLPIQETEAETEIGTTKVDLRSSPTKMSGSPSLSRFKRKRKSGRSIRRIQIQTASDENEETAEPGVWDNASKGMPSWLTSLLIHLSIILLLALINFSDRGRDILGIVASASETADLVNEETIRIALNPDEIETLSDEIEAPLSELIESSELAPVLEEALDSTISESEFDGQQAEPFVSQGLTSNDIPSNTQGTGAQFFGIDGSGSNFIFIVDCSDSMNDYRRWDQAVRELKQSVSKMKSNQKFLILLYNNGFIAMNDQLKMVSVNKQTKKRAFKWLGRLRPHSWTFCADAMAQALELEPDGIFLLSDGEFMDRDRVFSVLESNRLQFTDEGTPQPTIPVHTVALGSHKGQFTMQRIAEENGGLFRLID
ncbi:MAG: hypothetical protein AAGA30_10985 [Planctomycetota bacterium]